MGHQFIDYRAIAKAQPAGYEFNTVAYDHFQVIYLTGGRLHFRTSGVERVLTAGSGILLRMGSAFRLSCPDTGYRGVGVNLYEEDIAAFRGPATAFDGDVALHEVASLIEREIARPDLGTEDILAGLGSVLCRQALRLAGATSLPTGSARDWAERARQAIQASLTTGHGVRKVLATLPLSYRQLARHVTAHVGLSPKQYQQHCRLEEIKRLLRETSVSITTLAHEFGYPSSQHFSAQFRRATGMTPKVYRQQHGINS